MEANRPPGRILTFYSYKGGTGRTMCLANVAWLLASSGKRVLVIDWDLEAPGLHRYFQPFLVDDELAASEGLMDMVERYVSHAIQRVSDASTADSGWYLKFADLSSYLVSLDFDHFPRDGRIDMLPAGRQTDRYAVLVSSFNWQNFFDRLGGGGFLEAVKAQARAEYDYILIDSRTGVSDTAGICSVQMPDSLVVCLTYNNQNIKGAAAVARSAIAMKRKMTDEALAARRGENADRAGAIIEDSPREFRVFPVPMRVVLAESERLAMRQAFAQDAFSSMLGHLGGGVSEYWSLVEMPHISFYSYEEVLAPFKDIAHDPKSLLAAYVRLTRFLTDNDVTDYVLPLPPEAKKQYLNAFAATPLRTEPALAEWVGTESKEDALVRAANAAFQVLSDEERTIAQRVLLRLVRIGRMEEGGGYYRIRVSLTDFTEQEHRVIAHLAMWRLLNVATDVKVSTQPSPVSMQLNEQGVMIADDRLITSWKPMARWLEADHDFLLWRQQLRSYLAIWQHNDCEEGALLAGPLLREADYWTAARREEMSEIELEYVEQSRNLATRRSATDFTQRPVPTQSTVLDLENDRVPSPVKPHAFNGFRKTLLWSSVLLAVSGVLLWMSGFNRAPVLNTSLPPAPASASAASSGAPSAGSAASANFGAPVLEQAKRATLDIFWCVASGDGALALAQQMRFSLKQEMPFKEIRIKQLQEERNREAGYNVAGLQARPDATSDDERVLTDALLSTSAASSVAAATGYPWRTVASSQRTAGVLSIFICPGSHD
jgi:MinD-like ATPase involved in chromosome partitioning or flagellar assembly